MQKKKSPANWAELSGWRRPEGSEKEYVEGNIRLYMDYQRRVERASGIFAILATFFCVVWLIGLLSFLPQLINDFSVSMTLILLALIAADLASLYFLVCSLVTFSSKANEKKLLRCVEEGDYEITDIRFEEVYSESGTVGYAYDGKGSRLSHTVSFFPSRDPKTRREEALLVHFKSDCLTLHYSFAMPGQPRKAYEGDNLNNFRS